MGKVKQREKMRWCGREGRMSRAKSLPREEVLRSDADVEERTGHPQEQEVGTGARGSGHRRQACLEILELSVPSGK